MLDSFSADIKRQVRERTNSKNVGFLLDVRSSYLEGWVYPLAGQLWPSKSVIESWKN